MEEDPSAVVPEDGWRPIESKPEYPIRVLFIEGYANVSWMEKSYAGEFGNRTDIQSFRVWVTDPYWISDESPRPDAFGIERCLQEIKSGNYHCIVVVDCSNPELSTEFEHNLVLVTVRWSVAQWRLTVSLKNVPPHERCFGVTSESRTQSLVPFMSGLDVSKPEEPSSAIVAPEELDPDYDVVVAMHSYGKGCVAYFGDVNAEEKTIMLVDAFCQSRSPKNPIDTFSGLTSEEISMIIDLKEKGNRAYRNHQFEEAMSLYEAAIQKYGTKRGKLLGEERALLVTLHTNSSLVNYKKKEWQKSESCATMALELDGSHQKARFRRASARYEMGKAQGDASYLEAARSDIAAMPLASAAIEREKLELLETIESELKQREREGVLE